MSASQVRAAVEAAFRDFVTDGIPASGEHEPVKSEIRAALGELLETTLSAISAGIKRYATVAAMDADVDEADGQLAYVYENNGSASDPANGVYQWDSGTTAWVAATWYFDAVSAVVQPLVDQAEAAATSAATDAALFEARFAESSIPGYLGFLKNEAGAVLLAISSDGKIADISLPYFDVATGKFDVGALGIYDEAPSIPGISVITKAGDLIVSITYVDGSTYAPTTAMNTTLSAAEEVGAVATAFNTAVRCAAYTQWTRPLAVVLDGVLLGGAAGMGYSEAENWGEVWGYRRPGYDQFRTTDIAKHRASPAAGYEDDRQDDHAMLAALVDPRPAAAYPLMAFQAEHGAYPIRYWRSATGKFEDLQLVGSVDSATLPNQAYIQVFRNPAAPDEILLITRLGGSSDAHWYFSRSTDNAATWTSVLVFEKDALAAGSTFDLYPHITESRDGAHLHFFMHNRPQRPADANVSQRVLYIAYNWATGALELPWNGTAYVANVWDAGFTHVDPFYDVDNAAGTVPAVVFTPTGDNQTRLYDGVETADDSAEIVLLEFPIAGNSYGAATAYHVTLDLTDGSLAQAEIGGGGIAWETETQTNGYFGGLCIVGRFRVALAAWNAADTPGGGYLGLYDGGADGSAWTLVEAIDQSKQSKIGRPYCAVDYRWNAGTSRITWRLSRHLIYLRGNPGAADGGYFDFTNFDMSVRYALLPQES